MSLVLTLEQAPRSQKRRDARLDQGELVIGRSPEADWQIEDPDMFVSRAHCRVSGRPGAYFVTDTSSSGLFIDDANHPLGPGNTAELRAGMRLRLGDYVLWVDMDSAARTAAPAPANTARAAGQSVEPLGSRAVGEAIGRESDGRGGQGGGLTGDDFFSARAPEEPKPVRPAGLPNPFDRPEPGAFATAEAERPRSAAFDDPFSLDPVSSDPFSGTGAATPPDRAGGANPFGFDQAPATPPPAGGGGWFDDFGQAPQLAARPAEPFEGAIPEPFDAPTEPSEERDSGFAHPEPTEPPPVAAHPPWLEEPEVPPARPVRPAAPPAAPLDAHPAAMRSPKPAESAPRRSPPRAPVPPAAPLSDEAALRDAFLAGLGLDPRDFPAANPVAEMERLGREYRLMLDGLMQLLRKRAEEKGNARLAQTTVLGTEVNPLKFLPGVDEVLFAVMSEKSPGFLRGEAAVSDALHDLAEHHVRVWRGIQKALRRMIDRFDPTAIEKELESSSAVGQLLAGGRSAMLWKIYAKRHREIAQNAESRFMGEVGADFRDAYEEN